MRLPRNAKVFRGQLDAAPVAGVVFLLVIFLALNSLLVFVPGVPIELPAGDELPGSANPTLVVAVDRNGQLYYENQAIDDAHLKTRLRDEVRGTKGPVTLLVQADKAVSYETIVQLGRLAREVGIADAVLATRPKILAPSAAGKAQK